MKCYFITAAMVIVCGFRLFCQEEPHISIQLNEEERFRFEGMRLEFMNPGNHILIGDSAGLNLGNNIGDNIFIGTKAGYMNNSGRDNVFIGDSAGYQNLSGSRNTFTGCWAGYGITTGHENAFYSLGAGLYGTTGSRNCYYGYASGSNNDTGSYNTFYGFYSGFNNHGNRNVFLGYMAGRNIQGSDKLAIENSLRVDALIYGEFDTRLVKLHGETHIVDHDVYVTNPDYGIILTSPAGSCFRIRVDDTGALISEPIECP